MVKVFIFLGQLTYSKHNGMVDPHSHCVGVGGWGGREEPGSEVNGKLTKTGRKC